MCVETYELLEKWCIYLCKNILSVVSGRVECTQTLLLLLEVDRTLEGVEDTN